MKAIDTIKTADEARQYAIEWQEYASNNAMSWGQILNTLYDLQALAVKFNLQDEFRENGIL